MNIVIFLGPTLPVAEASRLLDAQYRGPAAMGDVYNVAERERPDVIGIIDGYFDSVPSVWHKEIIFALSRGIRVAGASSMGALRAAELSSFGMEGIGWVFEAFRSGVLEDDDEVAVVHDTNAPYKSLSTAMVNIRAGLFRAYDQGAIEQTTRDAMIALAKGRFYPERNWERLFRDAADHGLPPDELVGLRRFVDAHRPDVKREDACELLKELAATSSRSKPGHRAELIPTVFWDQLAGGERQVASSLAGGVRAEELRRSVKATDSDIAGLLRESLLLHLVQKECETLGIQLLQEQFDAAVRDFRLRHNLVSAEAMRAWLDNAGLSTEQFRAIMMIETRIAALMSTHAREVEEHLLDALALSGRLGETLTRNAAAEEQGRANGFSGQEPSEDELETFYRSRFRRFTGTLQSYARDLGFASKSDLLDEIRKIYEPGKG